MKRIVFAVTNDLSYDQRMHRICNTLSANGFEVVLVGRKLPKSAALREENYMQKRINCFFNRKAVFYAEYNIRLFLYILFRKADIYAAVDFDTLPAMTMLSIFRFKKLIFDAHEYFTEVPELEGRGVAKFLWKLIGRICLPFVSKAYTVNKSLSVLLGNKYKKEFFVVRNVPLYSEGKNDSIIKKEFILYQGAINKGRGLEELLYAMQEIDLKLVIAGDGDIKMIIRRMIDELKLSHKVEMKGLLPPEALADLTKNAFAGYNLLDGSSKSYYYSLSNKFFDYLHAHIPSISNDFPEYRYINGKFEVGVLTELDRQSIVESVNFLLNDEAYYRKLKDNCMLAAKHYCWQNEEKILLSIYEQYRKTY